MNIKPMLVRLEGALDRNDLIEQMVLLPEPVSKEANATQSVSLVVGYNASPKSQTALDLTMWIAHQTRLVTQKQVTVHVVYIPEENQISKVADPFNEFNSTDVGRAVGYQHPSRFSTASAFSNSATGVSTQVTSSALAVALKSNSVKQRNFKKTTFSDAELFEQANRILWQARCLAEEWKGSFKPHLRFGDIATELKDVVESESATLLFLGCNSVNHPIVQKLGSDFPCAVLGIPKD